MKQNSTVTLFHSFNYMYMPLRKATQLLPSHIFAASSADRLYHFTCLYTNERERIIPLQLGIASGIFSVSRLGSYFVKGLI